VKIVLLILASLICGVLAGIVMRGAAFADQPVDQQQALARAGAAARAASSVLVAVRWHEQDVQISRAMCDSRAGEQWRCVVRFRSGDGEELTGASAPQVKLAFSGTSDRPHLASCVLSDPEMGDAVDCTARAALALKKTSR